MRQNKVTMQLAEILERDIGPTINLWPAVQQRVGGSSQPRKTIPRVAWAAGIALVVLLGAATVAVALSNMDRAAAVDEGVDAIYKSGLVTSVNQAQTIDGVTVTLDWVYADPMRVVVAYSTDAGQHENFRVGTYLESLTLSDGTSLEPMSGSGYVETNTQMADITSLLMPAQAQAGDALEARLVLQVMDDSALLEDSQETGLKMYHTKEIGSLNFDLHIPITPGRIFDVDQEVKAADRTVKLQRLLVAPSGVRADVCFDVPDSQAYEWTIVGDIRGGGKRIEGGATHPAEGDSLCQTSLFIGILPLNASSYTLRLTEIIGFQKDPPYEQKRISGPWVFRIANSQ